MFHRAALHSAAAIDIVIDDKPYGHGSALHLSLLNSLRLFQINDVRTTQAGGHGPHNASLVSISGKIWTYKANARGSASSRQIIQVSFHQQ